MSADDKIAFSYDKDGNIGGALNISEIQRYQKHIAAIVVLNVGKDRDEYVSALLAAGRGRDETEKYMAVVGAVTDFAEIVDSMLTLLEAMGVDARAELQKIYTA